MHLYMTSWKMDSISNEIKLIVLYYYRSQDYPDTGISIGAYIVFYQGVPIYHWTHVTGPFSQYSAKSELNSAWTSGMALAHFRMLNIEFLNKYLDVVP